MTSIGERAAEKLRHALYLSAGKKGLMFIPFTREELDYLLEVTKDRAPHLYKALKGQIDAHDGAGPCLN